MQIDRIDCLDIPSCTQIFSCSPVFSAISRATLAIIGTFILFKNFVKKTANKWQVKVMLPCLKSCRPEGLSACLYAEKFLQKFGRNSYCFNLSMHLWLHLSLDLEPNSLAFFCSFSLILYNIKLYFIMSQVIFLCPFQHTRFLSSKGLSFCQNW